MAWIRACGGGGGGTPKKQETVFVKNGVADSKMTTANWLYSDWNMVRDVSQGDGYTLLSSSSNGSNMTIYGYAEKIDLTNAKTIYLKIKVATGAYGGGASIRVSDGYNVYSTGVKNIALQNYTSESVVAFDVSDLKGSYYVTTNAYYGYKLYIYDMWIEYYEQKYLFKDGNLKADTLPLYTDGVQDVAWDNGGYTLSSSFTTEGGFNFKDNSIEAIAPSSQGKARGIITSNPINLSGYSAIVVTYNNGEKARYSLNNYGADAYIGLYEAYNSSTYYFACFVSKTKNNILDMDNRIIAENILYGASQISAVVNGIALEKAILKPTDNSAVEWDNKGYDIATAYPTESGWILGGTSLSALVSDNKGKGKAIVTNNPIDLSEYSKLKVDYSFGTQSGTMELDISSVTNGYICFNTLCAVSNSNDYFELVVSSVKQYFGNNVIKTTNVTFGSHQSGRTANITRIWLE